jgi:hypothetical protein
VPQAGKDLVPGIGSSRFGDASALLPRRRPLRWALTLTAISQLLIAAPALADSVLVDAAVEPGGSPELRNASGTLRLVEPEFDGIGRVVFVPEPGFLWQLVPGLALLSILHRRKSA